MKTFTQFQVVILIIFLWSCEQHKGNREEEAGKENEAILASAKGANAASPYLTSDHKGNPVLCWTEELPQQEGFVVKFAVFDRKNEVFENTITIPPSKGTSAHPESMNKLAYKSDGAIVAAFAKKHPTEENRFSGSILYTQSFDHGLSWTQADFLHSDTSSTVGRGYFDVATLPDGEVGAIWLDGRYKEVRGSSLFFTKTTGKKGFTKDKSIGESTCECCRTDLYVDKENNLHIVYRDILNDSIRDVVYQLSSDNGETFSDARRISRDDWKIDGCPHTGPSLAQNDKGLHAVWFTAGGAPGVYLTSSPDNGKTFILREKISENAKHPQLGVLPDDKLVLVWDEWQRSKPGSIHAGLHQVEGHTAPSDGSKIVMQIRKGNSVLETVTLSDQKANASYPVLLSLADGKTLIAWSQEVHGKSGIYYKWLGLK